MLRLGTGPSLPSILNISCILFHLPCKSRWTSHKVQTLLGIYAECNFQRELKMATRKRLMLSQVDRAFIAFPYFVRLIFMHFLGL